MVAIGKHDTAGLPCLLAPSRNALTLGKTRNISERVIIGLRLFCQSVGATLLAVLGSFSSCSRGPPLYAGSL